MTRQAPLLASAALALVLAGFANRGAAYDFNDSHFHLTNYIQEGLSLPEFLKIMGSRTGRAAVFGIPLQQKWDYFESGIACPRLLSAARIPSSTTTRSQMRSSRINTCVCLRRIARGSIR